jgi:hypothetical protein
MNKIIKENKRNGSVLYLNSEDWVENLTALNTTRKMETIPLSE